MEEEDRGGQKSAAHLCCPLCGQRYTRRQISSLERHAQRCEGGARAKDGGDVGGGAGGGKRARKVTVEHHDGGSSSASSSSRCSDDEESSSSASSRWLPPPAPDSMSSLVSGSKKSSGQHARRRAKDIRKGKVLKKNALEYIAAADLAANAEVDSVTTTGLFASPADSTVQPLVVNVPHVQQHPLRNLPSDDQRKEWHDLALKLISQWKKM